MGHGSSRIRRIKHRVDLSVKIRQTRVNPCLIRSSKEKLQAELQRARLVSGVGRTKPGIVEVGHQAVELGVVKGIEELRAELELPTLLSSRDGDAAEHLEERQIPVVSPRTASA